MNKKISEKIEQALASALSTCRIQELETRVKDFIKSTNIAEAIESLAYVYSGGFAVVFLKRSMLPEIRKIELCKHVVIYPGLLIALPDAETPANYIVFDDEREMNIEYMQQIDESVYFVLLSLP